ncbi:hypothetical protein PENTCL1PPCAC_25807, partial [Pristionchus entomophagus]
SDVVVLSRSDPEGETRYGSRTLTASSMIPLTWNLIASTISSPDSGGISSKPCLAPIRKRYTVMNDSVGMACSLFRSASSIAFFPIGTCAPSSRCVNSFSWSAFTACGRILLAKWSTSMSEERPLKSLLAVDLIFDLSHA